MPNGETGGSALSLSSSIEVESCLDRALELDLQERECMLAELGRQQPEIAQGVRILLAELEELNTAGFLLESSPSGAGELLPAMLGVAAGERVGPYSLICEIGQGGMSSVWLARRDDGQLKREVALKLPVLGPRMQIERFMRERDILAALTHPNIARLYDAGVSESGQPYLAMEYVAGTTLTRSCDERKLTIRERLTLFVQVLQTVQFAHAGLVIHRDLKPSNILVTQHGRVVLLDFGIGKLLTGDSTDETHLTQLAGRAFTPYYASPEQITGQTLGTASDIYSLGVILYELLTGNLPYRPTHDSRAALEENIIKADLRRPSQLAISTEAASARGTSPRSLARNLAGDLDNIVLKALKKNPGDRYASASAFAQDVINYLGSLPVSARPDSTWYRVTRFTARHRIPVIAASVAATALLVGAALATWQARTASLARDRAVELASRNAAVTEFLGTLITDAAEADKPVTVSEMLARSEKLALANSSGSPENRAAVLAMIAAQYGALSEDATAARLFEKGLGLLVNSHDSALRAELTCLHASSIASLGQMDAAARAIEHELEHLKDDPQTAAYCLLYRSFIASAAHDAEPTLRYAQEGLDRFHSASQVTAADEGLFLGAVGRGYYLNGQTREADEYYRRAMQRYAELGREASANAITVLNNWAVVVDSAGTPTQALEIYDRALRLITEHNQGAPPPPVILGNRARALEALGRYLEAHAAYEAEVRRAEQQDNPFGQAHGLSGLASTSQALHDTAAAVHYLERLTAVLTRAIPAGTPPWMARDLVQARLDMEGGRFDSAREQFTGALGNPNTSSGMTARLGKSEAEWRGGDATAAANDARLALKTASAMQGNLPYSIYTGLAWLALGRAQLQLGHDADARQALENAAAHLSNTVDDGHPALVEARDLLSSRFPHVHED